MSSHPGSALQLESYLEQLPGASLRRLYRHPPAVFAIFRCFLPTLCHHNTHVIQSHALGAERSRSLDPTIVLTVLLKYPMPLLTEAAPDKTLSAKAQALSTLQDLCILTMSTRSSSKPQQYTLDSTFQSSMRCVLTGGRPDDLSKSLQPSAMHIPHVDVPFLERYAQSKLDRVLQFVVSNAGHGALWDRDRSGVATSVRDLLAAGHILDNGSDGSSIITATGFWFLLQTTKAQVWTLLMLWLAAVDAGHFHELQPVEALSFIFSLAMSELGTPYVTHALPEPTRNMLPMLLELGLIYIPSGTRSTYFPTHLATTLTADKGSLRTIRAGVAAATDDKGAFDGNQSKTIKNQEEGIIIETNYRIYFYTESILHIAVLGLFTKLKSRFPNMVAGILDRESVRKAFKVGITADQIIAFLTARAHPQMRAGRGASSQHALPPTVVDQIRLWELENERMKATPGFLFCDFKNQQSYKDTVSFAQEIGVMVWQDDERGMFFATKLEPISRYLETKAGK